MAELWTDYIWPLLIIVAESVLLLVLLLIVTAYVLYADRKIWAAVQIRRGPNVVGPWGLLQSFADLLKFIVKEPIIPAGANKGVFLLAPLVTAVLALSAWAVIPVNAEWAIADLNIGVLYIFAISSLMVYGVIMAGWSSNSKYPFLSSLRSAAQMVSYEVSIGFVIITVLLCAGSLNLSAIVEAQDGNWGMFNWYWLPLFPMFVIFFISALAETNRPPFDLVEAESELVAGYAVEYSATPFLLFFLGEYIAILTMCAMATILFLGGWLPPFPVAPFIWVPGVDLVRAQVPVHVLHVRHGEGHRSALPLRPAHAAGLEGVPAAFARHGRDRRGRLAIFGAGAEMTGERHDRFVACRPPGSVPGHCGGGSGLRAPYGIRRAQLLAARSLRERGGAQRTGTGNSLAAPGGARGRHHCRSPASAIGSAR